MATSALTRYSFLVFCAAALMAPHVVRAHHTTDHTQQQLEQERQQREYWRAQEQRRQEEQRLRQIEQETVRRRDEQAERDRRQHQQQPSGAAQPSSPQAGSSPQRSATSNTIICKGKPLAQSDQNPLVGRWRYVEAGAAQQNLFGQIFQMACPHYSGGFDFRARGLIAQGKPVPASYGRDGDVWWVCANGVTLGFRPQGANRLQMVEPTPNCLFDRAAGAER